MKLTSKELQKTVDNYEVEVTVDYSELEPFLDASYQDLAKEIKIPGFRPGKAPRQKIEEKLGSKVITEAVGRLLPMAAFEIVDAKNYDPVTQPEYNLKKIDEKEGIIFTFTFVNRPEVKIGDLSKIKVEREDTSVTVKDIDGVIRSAINGSVKPERIRELAGIKDAPKKTKKSEDGKEEKDELEQLGDYKINDELVKELDFEKEKTVEALRETVRKRLEEVKKQQSENKFADKIVEEAIKVSKIPVPQYFIDQEEKYQEDQFMERLKEINLDADTYLATQGSSLEEKKKEWRKEAEKRHQIDLLLINLANQDGKVATDADVAEEIDRISDPKTREQYQTARSREYIRTVLTRQRGLDKLIEAVEGKTKPAKKTEAKEKKASAKTAKKDSKK